MTSNISLVIRREYLERVSKKSFIITTLIMPVLMLLLSAAPALMMELGSSGVKEIAVVDSSGVIAPALESGDKIHFSASTLPADSLKRAESIDGVLIIGPDIVANPADVRIMAHDALPIDIIDNIKSQMERVIERQRIESYGIDDLGQILKEVQVDVDIPISRITDDNELADTSQALSSVMGIGMAFILYMFLVMYGQMVMTSIIEEKNNRVLEIMVSSIKPSHLMTGKIIGVGLVAVTQVLIWAALLALISAFVMPALLPDSLTADVAAYGAGAFDAAASANDAELVQVVATLGSVGYIIGMFGYMLLFLIGGFLFYAAINCAIGSAVDNIQDAGQLQMFVVVPIILGLVFSMNVIADPTSAVSVWMSFIPFTSPMVMMARIPFGIPGWQIALSLAVLYASFMAMVWISAKIYRVGIFMYGKKPSIKELIRWARYK